jgi:hypothetical protein
MPNLLQAVQYGYASDTAIRILQCDASPTFRPKERERHGGLTLITNIQHRRTDWPGQAGLHTGLSASEKRNSGAPSQRVVKAKRHENSAIALGPARRLLAISL